MTDWADLAGRPAVVTGAGSGIGLAFARASAEKGLKVLALDVSEQRLAEFEQWAVENGHTVRTALTDVSDYASVEGAAAQLDDWGPAALIVNNAGIEFSGRIWETDPAAWERLQAINVNGVFNVTRAFLPGLLAQGRPGHVVMVSSVGGLSTSGGMSGYIVSKFGVRVLAQCLAEELSAAGAPVGVTSVHPGAVRTNIFHDSAAVGEAGEELREKMRAHLDADGISPDDVAEATFRAVAEGRFWVHTHPQMSAAAISAQYESMIAGV